MRHLALIAILAGAVAMAGWLLVARTAPITVQNVRAFPVSDAQSAMVVLDIVNDGAPDRLVDVTASGAKLAVLKSPRIDGLPVPAATTVSLAMEAGHVMLMGVATPLDEGTFLPLDLEFERAGTVSAKALVGPAAMSHGTGYEIPPGAPVPTLSLSVNPKDAGWEVVLDVQNFTFARDLIDGPHAPGTGHAHLYVSGTKVGRFFETTANLPALPPGRHTVEVTLNTNDHRAYMMDGTPIAASVDIVSPQ